MFAIEIAFADGVSQPETILVRRPQALIGATDYAHVVIDDLRDLNYQIRLIRDLGRRFRTKPVSTTSEPQQLPPGIEGIYDGSVTLNLGKVRLLITVLDVDLQLRENETPDRAGIRILRQSTSSPSPYFPAVLVRGGFPMVVSFAPDQPIFIGRSKQCAVRLDSADISARHARLGFESRQFWIEDLGSTNGTFVDDQQISGRVNVQPGVPIVVGREVSILGVTSEEELVNATRGTSEARRQPSADNRYPILIAASELVRPAKIVLAPGMTLAIGRDPSSDVWVGAPHISRKHCTITVTGSEEVQITDLSTNGTTHLGGVLHNGESLEVDGRSTVFDLGSGVTIGICFSAQDEKAFTASHGAFDVFQRSPTGTALPAVTSNRSVASRGQALMSAAKVPLGLRARSFTGVLTDFAVMYRKAGTTGRGVFVALSIALVLVVAVIVNLLLPVWFR